MGRSSADSGGSGGRSSSGNSFRSSSGHRSSGSSWRNSRGNSPNYNSNHSSLSSNSNRGFSRGGGSYHGGYYGTPPPPPPPIHYGPRYRRCSGSASLGSVILVVLVFFVIIAVLIALSATKGAVGSDRGVQTSSIDRQKLPASMTVETGYYQDDLGWIGNAKVLKNGMKYFYQTTGVFPYLWITDSVDGDTWPSDDKIDEKLDEMYSALFQDEGHAIVMYLDAGDGKYITRCLRGASAKTVLDEEATEILLDYLDTYATSDMDDETYFATCFQKAADRMMSRTTNSNDVKRVAATAIAVVIVVTVLVVFFIRRRKLKLEQAKVDNDILNSRL